MLNVSVGDSNRSKFRPDFVELPTTHWGSSAFNEGLFSLASELQQYDKYHHGEIEMEFEAVEVFCRRWFCGAKLVAQAMGYHLQDRNTKCDVI